jgi:hypothetical protein
VFSLGLGTGSLADRFPVDAGTCDWNWGTNLPLKQSGRPSLPLPSHRCLRPHLLLPHLPRAMLRPPPRRPGKRAASLGPIFPFNPMGPFAVRRATCWFRHARRRERDGSLRVVYSASTRDCRSCPKRSQCQWNGSATHKPRQVSVLLHPLLVGPAPLLWRDWNRRHQRRACIRLHRQHLDIQQEPVLKRTPASSPATISRAQRAHYRLSWDERLARNARTDQAERITLTLFGIPDRLAAFLGLTTL